VQLSYEHNLCATQMDTLLGKIEGINDERDSVAILLAVRELWPKIKQQLSHFGQGGGVCN